MDEKLKQLLARYRKGEQLTQDELDLVQQYEANVSSVFGFGTPDLQMGVQDPLDLAYQRIKAGIANQNDVFIFQTENEKRKQREGFYKYDPSLTERTNIQSVDYTPDFMQGVFSGSTFRPQVENQRVNSTPDFMQGVFSGSNYNPQGQPQEKQMVSPSDVVSSPENLELPSRLPTIPLKEVTQKMHEDFLKEGREKGLAGTEKKDLFNLNNIPYFFPGGTDLTTKLYTFGRALGAGKDQKGRVPTAVLSGASALLGATRDVLSGVGYEKMNQQMMDEYRRRIGEPRFTPESQSRNQNNSGGWKGEFGGMFNTNYFDMGGEQGQMPQEMPQEGQQQDPQQMMQQMAQMVGQMLQQGQDPNQIVQMLVEQGVPQEQATSIVQMVIQQMQQQGSQEQVPTTKTGEPFNAQPGQEISFSYGGKKVTGKVKEIRNGKVILE